jgi:tetratricopeptide (TPR) repeat protein
MDGPDRLLSLHKLRLFRSVDIASSFASRLPTSSLLVRAKSLVKLRRFQSALATLDSLATHRLTNDEFDSALELRFACHLSMPQSRVSHLLSQISGRRLTPRLHILAADAYIAQDASPSPDHPAIPHLVAVLREFPDAIELSEKLLQVGGSVDFLIDKLPPGPNRLYVEALSHSARSEFGAALSVLGELSRSMTPPSVHALNQLCATAMDADELELFDGTARLIPIDNAEIVYLRAARLKGLRKSDELSRLVIAALNADEANANAWLAFSHFLELTNDAPRALQSPRKAIMLDRRSRRGYMRQGELRLARGDSPKALAAFTNAHRLREGMDSYGGIVHCLCATGEWAQAESYAARASLRYPHDGPHGAFSMTLVAVALKRRDVGRSVELLRSALQKGGNDREAIAALLSIKIEEGDLDEAEQVLTDFRRQAGEFFFFFKMGEIAALRKDFPRALEHLANALRIDPGSEPARTLMTRFEALVTGEGTSESEAETGDEGISF